MNDFCVCPERRDRSALGGFRENGVVMFELICKIGEHEMNNDTVLVY